jgi:hypothetical protein
MAPVVSTSMALMGLCLLCAAMVSKLAETCMMIDILAVIVVLQQLFALCILLTVVGGRVRRVFQCCSELAATADSIIMEYVHGCAKACGLGLGTGTRIATPFDDPAAARHLVRPSQNAHAACCTSGQPTYKGKEVNFVGLPTCSDGPCSGPGFDYRGAGASESPNPNSCCDTETAGNVFMYNPQATVKGATWPPIKKFPNKYAATGRQCNTEAPRFRCTIGGQVGAVSAAAAAAAAV